MNDAESRFLKAMAEVLEDELSRFYGRPVAFALVTFPLNRPELAGIHTNVVREDIVPALRKAADKLEGGADLGPVVGSA
jgi:hypothetical protein